MGFVCEACCVKCIRRLKYQESELHCRDWVLCNLVYLTVAYLVISFVELALLILCTTHIRTFAQYKAKELARHNKTVEDLHKIRRLLLLLHFCFVRLCTQFDFPTFVAVTVSVDRSEDIYALEGI